jgi:phosphotransferase system HPr-like phosphotransfer protein
MGYLTQIDAETHATADIYNGGAGLLVLTFTNTTRIRKVYVNVDVYGVAGNGAYTCFYQKQRDGAGAALSSIKDIKDAVTGETDLTFQSEGIALNATDVLTVYLLGIAADTSVTVIAEVKEELPDTDSILTAIAALKDFDPANDTVAHVTLVDLVTENTDMRGTDGANTVAPATPTNVSDAQAAIQSDIAGLNNFDPANDVVGRVSLVDTTTSRHRRRSSV